jgi:hypothetical protein
MLMRINVLAGIDETGPGPWWRESRQGRMLIGIKTRPASAA